MPPGVPSSPRAALAPTRPTVPARSGYPRGTRLALATLLALTAVPAAGQTPGREPAAAELTPGARALGLGMAAAVGSNDPDLAFLHPALVQDLQGIQGSYTWFGSGAGGFSLAAATDWFGGGVALSLHTLEYRSGPGGPGTRRSGVDDFFRRPPDGESVSETVATATWGRSLLGLDWGASARAYTLRHDNGRTTGQAVDVGVATEVGPARLALSGRNLGDDENRPTELVLGAGGYGQPVGPLDLGFAAQLRLRDDGELEAGGGLEFGYWPVRGRTFVGRIGLRDVRDGEARPVTFGGSFWGDSLVLDYAFHPVEGLPGVHRLSVGWR
ncbi:MAG: hypothetical protein RQ751_08230 [Longimicrobiales bacterium]|nr:hypothetical protein [Longimicrobiales bacterium]